MIYKEDVRTRIDEVVLEVLSALCEEEGVNDIKIDDLLQNRIDDCIDDISSIIAAVVSYNSKK